MQARLPEKCDLRDHEQTEDQHEGKVIPSERIRHIAGFAVGKVARTAAGASMSLADAVTAPMTKAEPIGSPAISMTRRRMIVMALTRARNAGAG
jgi:hypothetical protein